MINSSGFFSVIDHGVTINWDDGPTLHRMLAQVRYRETETGPLLTLRVGASQRCAEWDDENIDCFVAANGNLSAQWLWRELDSGWVTSLSVRNISEDNVYIESLDMIRIEATSNGLFNLGAPAQSWQLQTTPGQLLVQPPASDRSSPPALLLHTIGDAPTVQMTLDIGTAKFERLVIAHDLGNTKLAPDVTLASPEIWVIAGDNQQELLDLAVAPAETPLDSATPE